ncbi:MAG: Mur ligase family protein [Patescibacteria group bacterium]
MLKRIKAAKNIHVVGVSGTEGAAIALFLKKMGLNFTAHDFSPEQKFERNFKANHFGYPAAKREKMLTKVLAFRERIRFAERYLAEIEKADLIFVSQNWEAYSPNQKLRSIYAKSPEKFATITQLYFALFPGKIIAVTGTNGKSTTTKLIAEIMFASPARAGQVDKRVDTSRQQMDIRVYFTGNDRRNIQILDQLEKWSKRDWLVIEVSNRQLKFPLERAPEIGVITNVSPNHLNEYIGGFSAYKKGKLSLIARQKSNAISVLNYDNITTRSFIKKLKSKPLFFSTREKLPHSVRAGVYIEDGWIVERHCAVYSPSSRQSRPSRICPLDKVQLIGEHNLSNILAAIAATRAAGVSRKIICEIIMKFRGIPQRLEFVFARHGVKFVNDSASTTPESTVAALRSFPGKRIHLIAGGESKGMEYVELAREIRRQKTCPILLASPLAELLGPELKKVKVEFKLVKNLQEAIKISAQNAVNGDIVLLSPAAAWFCYFADKIPLGGRGFEQFAKALA